MGQMECSLSSRVVTFIIIFLLCIVHSRSDEPIDVGQDESATVPFSPSDNKGKLLQSCNSKTSNVNFVTCTGYPAIPTSKEFRGMSIEPTEVYVLIMNSNNSIQTLKREAFKNAELTNLKTLRLENSWIRTIENGAFNGLRLLSVLDLSNNKIDTLNMEMFEQNENDNLNQLILKNNPIHQFSGKQFANMRKLTTIDLSHCKIENIPVDAIKNLQNLQNLDLSSNKLKMLDWRMFSNSGELSLLKLHNNTWTCNCHLYFLDDFLKSRKKVQFEFATLEQKFICKEPGRSQCRPQITDLHSVPNEESNSNITIVNSELGKTIGFECLVNAYPKPTTMYWLKNEEPLEIDNRVTVNDHNHDKLQSNQSKPRNEQDEKDAKYRYKYSTLMTLDRIVESDLANYTCVAGDQRRSVYLNITNLQPGLVVKDGGSKVWLWILIGILLLLILVAIIIAIIGLWKRRELKRQKLLKQQVMENFKNSQTILDDNSLKRNELQRQSSKSDEAGAPLLPSGGKQVVQIHSNSNSKIPDVAQGKAENVRSLSPDVFSPRPMTADPRRTFFAQQEHTFRPGSSMSIYSNFGYGVPYHSDQRMYEIPQHPHFSNRPQFLNGNYPTRRLGSAQSLSHISPSYPSQRPILMRQFSGPAYSSMRNPRERRPPSVSSFTSEPQRPSYVTLPRNFGAMNTRADSGFEPSLSPTESNYSSYSYSTLPRRGLQPQRNGVAYDSVGPRTTVDGGSTLSLNKIGEDPRQNPYSLDSINLGIDSSMKGKIKAMGRDRMGSSTTPSSLRGRDLFSFEPIQEVEGSADDVMSQLPPESEVDKLFPRIQLQPAVHEAKYKKKRPPPMLAIPPRTRKPIRTFEYSRTGQSPNPSLNSRVMNQSIAEDPDEINDIDDPPGLPMSPMPSDQKTSIENIIEKVEGTEV